MKIDAQPMLSGIDALLPELEEVYKDLHRNPELSMQEVRTSRIAAQWLERHGFEVTREVGGTGVVGVLRNGEGPTVMLRADMDALPVAEASGLPYASTVRETGEHGEAVGVSHACGHDFHVTWLMGVARQLNETRAHWSGTVLAVFQPGEEAGVGAQRMMQDGMTERFPKPDIILGQHVVPGRSGTVGYRAGAILAAGDSMQVQLFGRGAHGALPQMSVDPVIMAASTTLRLQTIVSREIGALDSAVLTVGSLQAGVKENVIPEDATIKLNLRTYDEDVREYMLSAIRRICCAECAASNAPREPEFTTLSTYPLTDNDPDATARVAEAFRAHFGERAFETAPTPASEDFSVFGREWRTPYVYWVVGCIDDAIYDAALREGTVNHIPGNHSSRFAPALHPTLATGVETMMAASSVWLRGEPS
ncbi:amidohydrolase [Caballeronia sp. INDeC2]|uniref:amidohydrolase n=1 Tax=Caballeronia sp. INDeC2 TaxID=2921747 RepID=UPI0020280347|nr:amidohydrolase [Caballeronia sp. INDeC2]